MRVLAAVVTALVAAASAAAGVKPAGTVDGCPHGLVPLSATYESGARKAVTHFLTTTFTRWNTIHHWRIRLAGAEVGQPFLVRHWFPSGWVKEECGKTVWLRSVVVGVVLPAMEYPNPIGPCNACAHITFVLGDTRRGWIVWGDL